MIKHVRQVLEVDTSKMCDMSSIRATSCAEILMTRRSQILRRTKRMALHQR